jgi:oligopeptide transport system permease protein
MTKINEQTAFLPLDKSTLEHLEKLEQNASGIPEKPLFKRLMKERCFLLGATILLLIVLFAIFYPIFSTYSYNEINLASKNSPPSLLHIFGTDDLGRDLATRTASGARLSLFVGSLAAFLDLVIGFSWGTLAGYKGGKCDLVMMRLADLIYSLPYLLVVILIAAWIGPGLFSLLLAMCLIGWIQMARLVRIQVAQVKTYDYFKAALALGLPPMRIIFYHIVPNIFGVTCAMLMLTIPSAIFTEAFLSFLGIGVQPPLASLGSMVSDGLAALRFYPWRLFIPASVISLIILSFHLISDTLRDLLDPKTLPSYVE